MIQAEKEETKQDAIMFVQNMLRSSFASKRISEVAKTASSETVVASSYKPIADLFPSATVLFADISGFTACSSEREPYQVFILLESIYSKFDRYVLIIFRGIPSFVCVCIACHDSEQVFLFDNSFACVSNRIANKRRIFKVETIGDCYLAVAGLPELCKDHAIKMARFAHECNTKMVSVVRDLEVVLGPDTGEAKIKCYI